MENGATAVGSIGENGTERLTGLHRVARLDGGRRKVAIDGDLGAVADKDVEQAV